MAAAFEPSVQNHLKKPTCDVTSFLFNGKQTTEGVTVIILRYSSYININLNDDFFW
jgi:hypothetical protein